MNPFLSDLQLPYEEWKDIPGYEGLYQASTLGRIRTCEGKTTSSARFEKRVWKQRILKQKLYKNNHGRIDARICLWKNGVEKTWLVSRLIAHTWCEGYTEGLTVNHINGNPLDNSASNLEWLTISDNIKKGFAEGLFSKSQSPVTLCNERTSFDFESMASASRFLGRSVQYVSDCLKKNRNAKSINGVGFEIRRGAV
jgi:hypothetical protein